MITAIFVFLLIAVLGNLIGFALKATWGIAKILVTIILLPLTIIVAAVTGFIQFAIVALLFIGAVSFIGRLFA